MLKRPMTSYGLRLAVALLVLHVAATPAALGGASLSVRVTLEQMSTAHHLAVSVSPPPPEPQGGDEVRPLPFLVRVEARDASDALVTTYAGTASLSSSVGAASPAVITLASGVWTGNVTVRAKLDPPCYLSATDQSNASVTGRSDTFALCCKGDPTADGLVNLADVLRALRITLGRPVPTPPRYAFQFWATDMTGDGRVNAADLVRVVAKVLRAAAKASQNGSPRRRGSR